MTLYEFAFRVKIKGDIRVCKSDEEGKEILLMNIRGTRDLSRELPEEYEDLYVEFIFNGEDGTHIEVSDED